MPICDDTILSKSILSGKCVGEKSSFIMWFQVLVRAGVVGLVEVVVAETSDVVLPPSSTAPLRLVSGPASFFHPVL